MAEARTGRLVRRAIAGSRGRLLEVLVASLFVNLLALAIPVFMLQVYDRVVFHAGMTTLQGLAVGMALVLLFDGGLRAGRSRLFQRVGLDIDVRLGRALFEKVMRLPLRTLEHRGASSWHTLFRDVDAVRNGLAGPTAALVFDLPFALLFLAAITFLAPPLALVLLAVLPFFVLLAWRSGRVAGTLSEEERNRSQKRESLTNEIIAGRATVKSLALADRLQPIWERSHAGTIRASLARGTAGDAHQVVGHVMSMGTTVALTCVGALLILDQELTIGSLIAANMLSSRLVAPIAGLVGQWKVLQQMRQAARRLDEVFALAEEKDGDDLPFDRPQGQMTVEKVSFRYGAEEGWALESLDGRIGPTGLHCIVGRNGSGKSTLFKLLAGLYRPEEGRVLIDGADLAQFSRRQLARWIGFMPQEVVLFDGTVRENIQFGAEDADDAAVLRAAKLSGAHRAIVDLPDGYDTEMGEAGHRLSGGQRRRIAAARALVGDPPVLVLDEPSGDMDGEAEMQLAQGLAELAKDHTVIVATHSPAILRIAASVLVLDRGRVSMAGPAQEVLARMNATQRAGTQPTGPTTEPAE